MHSDVHQSVSNGKKLRRSRKDRVLAGVCGGLAEHFDVNANLLRAGFVLGTIITSGLLVPLVYLVCIFVLPPEEGFGSSRKCTARRSRRRRRRERAATTEVPSDTPSMEALYGQYDEIEMKIRKLEDYVTSKEYVLKRKFEEL